MYGYLKSFFVTPETDWTPTYNTVLEEMIETRLAKEIAFNQLKYNSVMKSLEKLGLRPRGSTHSTRIANSNIFSPRYKLFRPPSIRTRIKTKTQQPNIRMRRYRNLLQPNQWKK